MRLEKCTVCGKPLDLMECYMEHAIGKICSRCILDYNFSLAESVAQPSHVPGSSPAASRDDGTHGKGHGLLDAFRKVLDSAA